MKNIIKLIENYTDACEQRYGGKPPHRHRVYVRAKKELYLEIFERLDRIEKILNSAAVTDTVDDVRWVQAKHKTAKEILDGKD